MFSIDIKYLYWLDKNDDNVTDLCLHGDVVVIIGDERFEESCTVSAAAFYLLKTLTENHIINEDNQMLPCCGFSIYPKVDNDESNLIIIGCPNGIDWSVIHCDGGVEITTESGNKVFVEYNEYKTIVYNFAGKIKDFYDKSLPREVTGDNYNIKMYHAFWKEWERRRKSHIIKESKGHG